MASARVSNLCLFSVFAVLCFTAIRADKEAVLTLDSSNFADAIKQPPLVVVAPWCGHCNKLAPEYEKAAAILSKNDPPIILAKVDANEEQNKELATAYHVKGFPAIKILRDGGKIVHKYKGPREADGIVSYLKKQSGPASVKIKSADDATTIVGEKKIIIVGVVQKFSGDEYEKFMSLAQKLRSDYEFGHTLDAKHLPHGDSSVTGPLVRLFKPFDELFVDSKEFNEEALEKFIEKSSLPIVTLFNNDPDNHPFVIKSFNSQNDKAMLFLNLSSDAADAFKSKYREVAEKYKGEGLSFLIGDLEASKGALVYFRVKEDQVPLIIVQTNDGNFFLKPHLESQTMLQFG